MRSRKNNKVDYSILYSILIGVFVLILCSCEERKPATTRAQLIENKLQERIAQLHRSKQKRCLEEAMQEAEQVVDSLILELAKSSKDSISKPPKPTKPERPDAFILMDTGNVHPLIIDTLE